MNTCPTAILHVGNGRALVAPETDMEWAIPKYSRNQADKAGFVLADPDSTVDDFLDAANIMVNWRSSHSYPLNTFQMTLRQKCKGVDTEAIVAQRLKRLESMIAKLQRFKTMQLSQMQDIGGCRAIVSTIAEVQELVKRYEHSQFDHKLKGKKDYIASPKPDGYRSVHLIYQYVHKNKPSYNKMCIEIQIRTQLQHAWATAVEAVGTFTEH